MMAICLNLERRPDRRTRVLAQFANEHLSVEMMAAVDGQRVRNTRRQGTKYQYACQLSHRIAIRRALQSPHDELLVFEDDVVLNPGFVQTIATLNVPEDWGIILYGCTHTKMPGIVSPGLVRVRGFWGTHAYRVRRKWFRLILREMRRQGTKPSPDNALSRLARTIPIYAPFPNLAWQEPGRSDLRHRKKKMFTPQGDQIRFPEIHAALHEAFD